MDLRQLEMFLAVLGNGGYAKAGEYLHVSHSAIHRQVKMLEAEIENLLLYRKGRRVELTEARQILAVAARRVRQELSDANRQLSESSQSLRGQLRIGTGSSILASFLPPVLERYRKESPGVEVRVVTGTADQVIENVENSELDLGLVFNPADMPRRERRFVSEILYREEFVWAVPRGHPLAKRKRVALEDLAQFPFLILPKTSHIRRTFDRLFQTKRLTPRVAMELENEEALEKLIEINLGITLRSSWRSASDKMQYLRMPGEPVYCDMGMLFPRSKYIPRVVTEFARLARQAASVFSFVGHAPLNANP